MCPRCSGLTHPSFSASRAPDCGRPTMHRSGLVAGERGEGTCGRFPIGSSKVADELDTPCRERERHRLLEKRRPSHLTMARSARGSSCSAYSTTKWSACSSERLPSSRAASSALISERRSIARRNRLAGDPCDSKNVCSHDSASGASDAGRRGGSSGNGSYREHDIEPEQQREDDEEDQLPVRPLLVGLGTTVRITRVQHLSSLDDRGSSSGLSSDHGGAASPRYLGRDDRP